MRDWQPFPILDITLYDLAVSFNVSEMDKNIFVRLYKLMEKERYTYLPSLFYYNSISQLFFLYWGNNPIS